MHYLAGAVVLVVYLLTLCPTVYVGDSGELITAAASLGAAHPPGYPLYLMVGRLFSLSPVGSAALALNFFSALCGAAAAAVLVLLLRDPAKGRERGGRAASTMTPAIAAVTAVLLFSFARTVWTEMVKAEVYSLAVLMAALVLLAAQRAARPSMAFFLLGLGAANHQTILLLTPGVLLLVHGRWGLSPRLVLEGVIAFAIGASAYLLLLARPASHDLFAWRQPTDWSTLWAHITRAQYGELSGEPRSVMLLAQQFAFLVKYLLREALVPVLLLPLAIVAAWKTSGAAHHRSWAIHFCLFSLGLLLLLNHGTGERDLAVASVYYIPAIMVAAILSVTVLQSMARRLEQVHGKLPLVLLLLPLATIGWNWSECDASEFRLAEEAGRAMLDVVGEDDVILTEGDNATFILYYLQRLEGVRPDVTIVDRDLNFFPEILGVDATRPGWSTARDDAVEELVAGGSDIYSATRFTRDPVAGKRLISEGPVWRFSNAGVRPEPRRMEFHHPRGFPSDIGADYMARRFAISYLSNWLAHQAATGDGDAFGETKAMLAGIGEGIREAALVRGIQEAAAGDTTNALVSLEQTLGLDPEYLAARQNLANLYVGMDNWERAAEEFQLIAERTGAPGDWLNLGNALWFDKRGSESEVALRKALPLPGADWNTVLGLAMGFGRLGIDSIAIPLFAKARDHSPDSFDNHEALGDCYDRSGLVSKALECYEIAARNHPESPAVAYKKGVALLRLGRHDESARELERTLDLDSTFAAALNAVAFLQSGKSTHLEEGLGMVNDAIRIAEQPSNRFAQEIGYYYDTRGVILARLGRPDEAAQSFRLATDKTPRSDRSSLADSWNHLADVLEQSGLSEEAASSREMAKSILR